MKRPAALRRTITKRPKAKKQKTGTLMRQMGSVDFEPISEFSEDLGKAAARLHDLGPAYRLALVILGHPKPKVVEAVRATAQDGTGTAMLDTLENGHRLVESIREIIVAAETRVMIATASLL